MLLSGGYAFLFSLAITVNLVYQTQQAGLTPLQLVLVGTVLQATIFLCEIPTGVIADLCGRRLSIVVGLTLLGLGFALNGAIPEFETIMAAQVLWGCGLTFLSGAHQAWIADEVGVERAGSVYFRSSQVDQVCRIIAIPISVGLATIQLNVPLLVAGGLLPVLAVVMLIVMPENGFQRPRAAMPQLPFNHLTGTVRESGKLIRHSPLLMTLFCISAFYGMASQGFDRLWVAHFYENLGFPGIGELQPVVWFGIIRFGTAVGSILAVEVLRRHVNTSSHASVSRWLFAINAFQMLSLLVFAFSGDFLVGMLAVWSAVSLSRMYDPLQIAWINQNVPSHVRATVISLNSQTASIGQIAGGPVLGVVGTLLNLRAAMLGAALALAPALLLYMRAFHQGAPAIDPEAEPESVPGS
jgi:MFS transporter, DHA3 family, tetracycline resistance protein